MKTIISVLFTLSFFISCNSGGSSNTGGANNNMGGANNNVGGTNNSMGATGGAFEVKIQNYIKVISAFRQKSPDLAANLNEKGSNLSNFSECEQIIKNNGISSYAEFKKLNLKIGGVYGLLQAQKEVGNMKNYQNTSKEFVNESEKEILESLKDPDVPADVKADLRKTLEEVRNASKHIDGSKGMVQHFERTMNKKIRKKLLKLANKPEISLIMKYQKQLTEAYTGIKQ